MEELKIGMLVRTKNHNGFPGGIGKIRKIEYIKNTYWITLDRTLDHCSFLINISEIVKASFDIIDIIEVGDYVNQKLINYIEKFKDGSTYLYYDEHGTFVDYQIESIVTHEQFEHMKYRIGD
jgi:hypothetical protein